MLLRRLPAFAADVFKALGINADIAKRSVSFGPAADGPNERQLAADVAGRRARFRAELVAGLTGADLTAANATIDAFEAAAEKFAPTFLALQDLYDQQQQARAYVVRMSGLPTKHESRSQTSDANHGRT